MAKEITVEEYKDVSQDFFEKYNYVAERLPQNTKAEDVLKVMQQLAALVIKKRAAQKSSVGFYKEDNENDDA